MRVFTVLFSMWLFQIRDSIVKFMSTGPGNQVVTPLGAFGPQAAASLLAGPFVPVSAAAAAINPHAPGRYVITYNGGAGAYTLAAPTVGLDDGVLIEITSLTAQAHVLTATGLLNDGTGHVNTATFGAHAGAMVLLCAYQGKWYVQANQSVTTA